MIDVLAMGELLVDFVQSGHSDQGNPLYEASPGGAPCNVLAMLSRLGRSTEFVGKLGNDLFGRQLTQTLVQLGIGTRGLVYDDQVRTTLAFVQNDEAGERSFAFYRNPGADMMLRQGEIDLALVGEARIFHFGTISMTHDGVRQATRFAAQYAKERGKLISFDPNIRLMLWDDLNEAHRQMEYGCQMCDVLKIAEDELKLLTGSADWETSAPALLKENGMSMLLLTLGKEGSVAFTKDYTVRVPGYTVRAVDTTGAGDSFMGCCLHHLLNVQPDRMNGGQIEQMLQTANAAAAIVTTRKGALRSMPCVNEISALQQQGRL